METQPHKQETSYHTQHTDRANFCKTKRNQCCCKVACLTASGGCHGNPARLFENRTSDAMHTSITNIVGRRHGTVPTWKRPHNRRLSTSWHPYATTHNDGQTHTNHNKDRGHRQLPNCVALTAIHRARCRANIFVCVSSPLPFCHIPTKLRRIPTKVNGI